MEAWYSGALALLPLLPLSMMTAWRLHALAGMPGALAAVLNGTLCARTASFQYDAGALRTELVHHLEWLTGYGTPGLGRTIYGSHPSLTSRARGGEMVHALI